MLKIKTFSILMIAFVMLFGCTQPGAAVQTPTGPVTALPTLVSTGTPSLPASQTPQTFTAIPALTASRTPPPVASDLCTDQQATALIDSLKSAMFTANGEVLSSLVSPASGMEVRYVRHGNAIKYTTEQARFLFETTYEANWGAEPGSGSDKIGSFHDVIVPELVKIFKLPYTLHCNELKHGGASYELEWPYQGGFYAVYFPGTDANGFLDWHTWAVGIEYVNGKPYIYAMMQFFWEP